MLKRNIIRGLGYGLVAGLVSTIVTDLVSLAIFYFIGESLPSFFALIGRSFLTLINIDTAFPFWQGLGLHYSIGIITGLVLGVLTQLINVSCFNTFKKSVLISIIITQIEGTTLFFLMSLILQIPQSEMLVMYGLGFILHLIWGSCLGLIVCLGRRRRVSIPVKSTISEENSPRVLLA